MRNSGGTITQIYVCQQASESLNDMFAPPADFLDALSHFSIDFSKKDRIITDMQGMVSSGIVVSGTHGTTFPACFSDQKLAIHGGVIHSTAGDSGTDDDGVIGLTYFREHHECSGAYCFIDELIET